MEIKRFYSEILKDYRTLKDNNLHVHLKKDKTDEGYYLGLYINEKPNEYSVKINSIQSYVDEFRKHDEWFFNGKKDYKNRLRYIQAMLDL